MKTRGALILLLLGLLVAGLLAGNVAARGEFPYPTWQSEPLQVINWDDAQMAVGPFWQSGVAGRGVRVAVVDTGVDDDHPFFQGRVRTDLARDVVDFRRDCQGVNPDGTLISPYDLTDCHGHGTHVAGVVAADGSTPWGPIRGIAYEAEIVPVKVLSVYGGYDNYWDWEAIDPGQVIRHHFDLLDVDPLCLDVHLLWDDPHNDFRLVLTSPTGRQWDGVPNPVWGGTSRVVRNAPIYRELSPVHPPWTVAVTSLPGKTADFVYIQYVVYVASAELEDIAAGITYAADHADVINLSVGRPESHDPDIENALAYALGQGAVVIAAAGNEHCPPTTPPEITLPGSHIGVVTVGATGPGGEIALFSSRGPTADGLVKPDVVAPGGQIRDCNDDPYVYTAKVYSSMSLHSVAWPNTPWLGLVGTSQAAPEVSGLAALLIDLYRDRFSYELTPMEIKALLQATAVDQAGNPRGAEKDNDQGTGRVNGARAYLTFPFSINLNSNQMKLLYVRAPDALPTGPSFIPLKGAACWSDPDYNVGFFLHGGLCPGWDKTAMCWRDPWPGPHNFAVDVGETSRAVNVAVATTYPPDVDQVNYHGYWHNLLTVPRGDIGDWYVWPLNVPVENDYPLHSLTYWSSPDLVDSRLFYGGPGTRWFSTPALPQVLSCLTAPHPVPGAGWYLGLQNLTSDAPLPVSVMTSYVLDPNGQEFWPGDAYSTFLPVIVRGFQAGRQAQVPQTPTPLPTPPAQPTGYPPGPLPTPGGPTPPPTPRSTPVDPDPPVSQMGALPLFQNAAAFSLTWSGYDVGSSGLRGFDVQARPLPDGPWVDLYRLTRATVGTFDWGQDGQSYGFRCRAWDNAWNRELFPAEPETVTTVDLTPPTSAVAPLPPTSPVTFTVAWSGEDATSGVAAYDVQLCRDDCANPLLGWTDWLTHVTATAALFTAEHGDYFFRSRAVDRAGHVEAWPPTPDAWTRVDAPLLGRNFPLTTGPSPQTQEYVAAAYAPAAHLYLAAWEQNDAPVGYEPNIYARLVSDEGSVLLEPIPVAVAPGPQQSPAVAYDPDHGQFLVVWAGLSAPPTSTGLLDIWGRFYDPQGRPLAEPFLVSRQAGTAQHPSVAYGGGAFLVAWDADGAAVYGRFVDPAGQGGSLLPLAAEGPVDEMDPAVAYGSGTFLVAWTHGTDLAARRVDRDGSLGPVNVVSDPTPTGVNLAAVAAGADDTYLLTWAQAGPGMLTNAYARLVDRDGVAPGRQVLVGGSPWGPAAPHVAFGGGQYLVVFESAGQHGATIWAARVSAQGELVGEPSAVRGGTGVPGWPAVAAGPGGEFLALWQEQAAGFIANVYAQRLAGSGDLVGPALLVGAASLLPDQDIAAVAYGADLYLAAWEEVPPVVSPGPDYGYEVYGRFVDPGGAFPGAVLPLITGTGDARMPALAYNPGTGEFLLAYAADGLGGPPQVYVRRIGPAGPVGVPLLVAASAFSQTHPALAAGGAGRARFLLTWQQEGRKDKDRRIYALLLDGAGQPAGAPFVVADKQGGGEYQRDPAVAADPGTQQFLVVWSGRRGQERIYLQTVDYDGVVDTDPPVEVSAPAGNVETRHPAISGQEGGYVVAWARVKQDTDWDIYTRRARPDKTFRGPEETLLADVGVDQFLPAGAAAGPDEVLVVWQEGRNSDVVGQRLHLSDGALVGGRLAVSRAAEAQLRPAVAGDLARRRYLTVWTDGRSVATSGLDIYGQLIRGF